MTIPDRHIDVPMGTTISPHGFGRLAGVLKLRNVIPNVSPVSSPWIRSDRKPAILIMGTFLILRSDELNRILETDSDEMNSPSSNQVEGTPLLPPHSDPKTTSRAIFELRRISGLNWDELAQLFEVSRDTIHSWASRKPLDADEERRIMRALDVVRYADRGTSRATRKALHDTDAGTGRSPFELLAKQRFDEASKALGKGTPMYRPKLGELDQKSKDARKPLPLEVLLNARQDRIHEDLGRTRVVRSVRKKRRDDT